MEDLSISVRPCEEVEELIPILRDALPCEDLLRAELASPAVTAYGGWLGEALIGAIAVRWEEPSEITLLGVASQHRRRGFGRHIVAAILDEARARKVRRLLVGTASFSLDNILFYQKCGFRMSHVRRDFFAKEFPTLEPFVWQGITLRDMIVFDFEFGD